MKVSDYIVSFFIERGITDVFGYPGGMVTHLMDSLSKYSDKISAHVNYHEQGSAFAACGYAQASLKPGVAYATSGPGATNLVTGIANAYFDSIPTIFITGQVNTYESKGNFPLRQKGFQEMDVVAVTSSITKYCVQITDSKDVRYHLEKAYHMSLSGRPGPVLLDIPMNIQRADINLEESPRFENLRSDDLSYLQKILCEIEAALEKAKRPCILVGAGVQSGNVQEEFAAWIEKIKVPVVSSMLAVDILPLSQYYYGFVGAYGSRCANFILAKSDLIISLGTRMDLRQTGANTDKFAVNARLIRIDIDSNELSNKVKVHEESYISNLKDLQPLLTQSRRDCPLSYSDWIVTCNEMKNKLENIDDLEPNRIVQKLSGLIDADTIITTDVGQNQVWVAQSFIARGQRILFSGGHGAMGYSLPAAIGAHYGSGKKIVAFTGDGGLQMNIQELQFIAREQLPITIILLNNSSLGMIRHFQEMYFDKNYVQTKKQGGYTTPDFGEIASAYGILYYKSFGVSNIEKLDSLFSCVGPSLIEVVMEDDTYVFPKLAMGKLNQDQDPELNRELYEYLSDL